MIENKRHGPKTENRPLSSRNIPRLLRLRDLQEVIIVNEFNEYVREVLSEAGDIVIRSMMGGYLVYLKGKLIGDICDNELFLKRTPTSDRLLADSDLRYPYEGSKTLMHVFDRFEDTALILELLDGMYAELPEKKPAKARARAK